MSVGGDSWETAAAIAIGGTSDPTPRTSFAAGSTSPYYSAWWKFTPAADCLIYVNCNGTTGASGADTVLYVYSGTEGAPVVEASDDDGGDGYLSATSFSATAGTEYRVRVGSYDNSGNGVTDYVLDVYSSVPGPWLDDAQIAWYQRDSATGETDGKSVSYYSEGYVAAAGTADWDAAAHKAWDGDSTITRSDTYSTHTRFSQVRASGVFSSSTAIWRNTWVTVQNPGGTETVSSSSVPPELLDESGNFVDPDVIGVEWEPTSTPYGQRLDVTLDVTTSEQTALSNDVPIKLKLGSWTAALPYDPGFETAATVAARGTVGTFDTSVAPPRAYVDVPGDASSASTVAVAVVDTHTDTQTPFTFPVAPSNSDAVVLPTTVRFQVGYRPRYRLIYRSATPSDVATAPNLLYPRSRDARGIGAGLVYPRPSAANVYPFNH